MESVHADLGDSKLYFSTAIELQLSAATTEVGVFSSYAVDTGLVSASTLDKPKGREYRRLCYPCLLVCKKGESSIEQ